MEKSDFLDVATRAAAGVWNLSQGVPFPTLWIYLGRWSRRCDCMLGWGGVPRPKAWRDFMCFLMNQASRARFSQMTVFEKVLTAGMVGVGFLAVGSICKVIEKAGKPDAR